MTREINTLDKFLQERMREGHISSTALVFTFFCDVVTQHGGEIWLGSVIEALAPLGVKERLTRTSVFRLVQDGWLESRKEGRRSYYRLTQTGQNYYDRAAIRVYASTKPAWDGTWTILFTSMVSDEKRDALNRGLLWLGYGRMAAGVYALPGNQRPALNQLLADHHLLDAVVTMQARADDADGVQKLVKTNWKLDDLRQRYKDFIRQYGNAQLALRKLPLRDGHRMLLLRILLIHEYRKILLSDPELPPTMLPGDWEGYLAQTTTADMYRQLVAESTSWVNTNLLNSAGYLTCDEAIRSSRFPPENHETHQVANH